MATGVDASRETEWGELAEAILLFVNSACCSMLSCSYFLQSGLFAAVLTAFLLFTMTKLQAESSDISKDILLHISLQLHNRSLPAFVKPEFFVVEPHWANVNALLFASLALVLVDAYLAVLTRGWLRDFDRSWKSSNVPEERARKREMRLQGLNYWKLRWVVALLPLLIQASLILYSISLVIMLINIYPPIAHATLAILVVAFGVYFLMIMISTFDTNSPFPSFYSKALQVVIRWSRRQWSSRRTTHSATVDAKVEPGGSEIHLAISNRLRAATSNAVENLPVLMEIFDQWMRTPGLQPLEPSDWVKVLPLIQPYLSNGSLCDDNTLRSVLRLFLCFNSKEFNTGRRAVIKALENHDAGSIERLYIHFLQPDTDQSPTYQMVLDLENNKQTIIELRLILDWVVSPPWMENQEIPNKRDSRTSMHNATFLCSTAVYIIRNKIMDDDHGLFDSLLLTTRLFAERSQKLGASLPNTGPQTNSNGIGGTLSIPTRPSRLLRESQWGLIRDLHTMSCTSVAGRNHNFRLLIMLLMVSMNSADKYLDIYDSITYDLFTHPESDLPILMDILWETLKSPGADRHLLIGIAAQLLQQDRGPVHKSSPNPQQSAQDLLNAYDFYTSESTLLMTSNGLDFIQEMLSPSVGGDGDSKWEPQTAQLSNPWLVMHINNIPRRGRCVPVGSTMGEAVLGRLDSLGRPGWLDRWLKWLDRLDQQLGKLLKYFPPLHERLLPLDRRLKQLKQLMWLDQFSPLDPLFKQLGWFDQFDRSLQHLNQLEPCVNQLEGYVSNLRYLDQVEQPLGEQSEQPLGEQSEQQLEQQLEQLEQLEQQLKQLDQQLDLDKQLHQLEQQRSTVLGMIAKFRLRFHTLPHPDLVALSLFLSPRYTDIYEESRRLILELFSSTPSPSPPDQAEPGVVDARALCSDFFDSEAIGDLTKWRLLSLVVFQEWGKISTGWKDLLAEEALKADWMARVTPLLAGKYNLSEFMVAADSNSDSDPDSTYGSLAPSHLHMVTIIVEHLLEAERLTNPMTEELEEFLKQHSHILCDLAALRRIRKVIGQAKARSQVQNSNSGVITAGPSHSPE